MSDFEDNSYVLECDDPLVQNKCIQCDFCGCNLIASSAFTVHGPAMMVAACDADNGEVLGGWSSPDNWAACHECFNDLIDKNYQAIIERVLVGAPDDFTGDARAIIADMLCQVYRELSIVQ